MICFEVWVNGEKVCLAGVDESGVLCSIIDGGNKRRKSNLYVGGLVDDEDLRWTQKPHPLEVGDEITIKIVEADAADEPTRKFIGKEPQDSI
jgi:hypothetical protein